MVVKRRSHGTQDRCGVPKGDESWYADSRGLFFFQAEDGIRDHCVTGVQTCALPICAYRNVKYYKAVLYNPMYYQKSIVRTFCGHLVALVFIRANIITPSEP